MRTAAILLLSLGTIFILFGFINIYNTDHAALISAIPSPPVTPHPKETGISEISMPENNLEEVISEALDAAPGEYGIVVKNLKTGESYFFNEHKVFEPASLYKLWVMAAAYKAIENGSLSENQIISQNIAVLNSKFKISSESAELTRGTVTRKVSEAIAVMITNSDNYSALLLSEKIRNSNIQKFLRDNGFEESSLGIPPKSTPADISLFFEKLYSGELGTEIHTEKMIKTLKQQNLNHKIPKYLPPGTIIGHKTGELGYFTHDAGIVFSENGDYIIVIMSESNSPKKAEEKIANIAKAVFKYFNN